MFMFHPALLLLLACTSATRHGAGAFVTLTPPAISARDGRIGARCGRGGGVSAASAATSTSTSLRVATPAGRRAGSTRRSGSSAYLSMSSSGLERKRSRTPSGRSAEGEEALPELNHEEVRRYSRHLILPEVGVNGQRRLKASSVLAVGTGGLGSPALLYLAAAGVGRLGIVDDDVVDESNLQRQVRGWVGGSGGVLL